jgi:hypothetical protein
MTPQTTLIALGLMLASAPLTSLSPLPLESGDQTPVFDNFVNDSEDEVETEAASSGYEWTEDGKRPKPTVKSDLYIRGDFENCQAANEDSVYFLAGAQYAQDGCPDGMLNISSVAVTCPPETYQIDPLYVRRLQQDGSYGPTEFVGPGRCVAPADLAAEAERAFTSMHVPAPTATLQTGNPTRLLVNAWYPVYASDDVITQTAALLEVPVEVRAVPAQYTWDFDDPFSPTGPTLTTTNPGQPWIEGDPVPDERWVAHAWTRLGDPDTRVGQAASTTVVDGIKARDNVTVTLTTTWHGQFRIVGTTTWADIPGQLTTTSPAGTYTVTEARTRLYCDDLNGHDACAL